MLRTRTLLSACLVLGLTATAACTPQERAAWNAWHEESPAAAEQFAIDHAAEVSATADRVNGPDLPLPQIEEELPADLCADASSRRAAVGLPARFDKFAFRESRCQNDVRNSCCFGIYQLNWGVISRDHRMGLRIAACGVGSVADIYGETPVKRRNNTCVAKALYDVAGYSPWAL